MICDDILVPGGKALQKHVPVGLREFPASDGSRFGHFRPTASGGTSFRQTLDKAARELDQRVVARTHDEDAVSGFGLADEHLADVGALGNVLRVLAMPANFFREPV